MAQLPPDLALSVADGGGHAGGRLGAWDGHEQPPGKDFYGGYLNYSLPLGENAGQHHQTSRSQTPCVTLSQAGIEKDI